jgi:hemerythrin-like domain-containing protein
VVAWSQELRQVHVRLREALRLTQEALDDGRDAPTATADLLLYCRGFCAALDGHHRGEERALFPAVAAAHPQLRPVLRSLQQDHSMIGYLLAGLAEAADRSAPVDELRRHLDGLAAVMENHFRYEERRLLVVLEALALAAPVREVLGPL